MATYTQDQLLAAAKQFIAANPTYKTYTPEKLLSSAATSTSLTNKINNLAQSVQTKEINTAQSKLVSATNSGKVTQADLDAYQAAVKAAGGTPQASIVTKANTAIKASSTAAAEKAFRDSIVAEQTRVAAEAAAKAAADKAAADKAAAEKTAAAKAASDKIAADKAAADKAAADKAAADKAAATAAAASAKLGEKYTTELANATTQAQLDDIKARAAAEGATINAGVLDNATKAVVQKEAAVATAAKEAAAAPFLQELGNVTSAAQLADLQSRAQQAGVELNAGQLERAQTGIQQAEAKAAEAAQAAAAAPFLQELNNVTSASQLADLQSRAQQAGVTLNAGQLERAQTGVQQAEAAAAKEAQAATERAAAETARNEKLAAQQQAAYDYASKLVAPTGFENKFTPGGVELQGVPDDPTTAENESGWYAQTPDGLQKIGSDGKPTGPVIPNYDDFNARADQIRTNTAAFEQKQQADQAALAATTLATNTKDFEAALPTPADFLATGKSILRGPDGSEYSLTPANLATGAPQQWIKQDPNTQAVTNLNTGTTVSQGDYRDTIAATDAANSQVSLEQRAALGAAQREEAAGPDFGDFAKVLAVAAIATIAAPYVASMFSSAGAGALSATEAASTAASMAEAGASAGEIAGALEAAGLDSVAASAVADTATGIAAGTVDAASIAATSVTPEMLTAANATLDPIAALNAGAGWAPVDTGYLASIGASPELIAVGEATNIGMGLDAAGLNILSEAETLELMSNIDPNMISSLAPTTAGTAGGTSSIFSGEMINPITDLASKASDLGSMFSGSSINPISNLVANAGITNPVLAGALTGAGTGAVINLATGQPITGQSLALGALGGGVAGGIGGYLLPDMGTGMLGAGLAGAATNVGATAVVSLVTGQPITTDSLAGAALIGGAVGAGSQAVSDAFGNTTYRYDDGSSITVNSKGTPVTVTDNTGTNVPVGAVDTRTGQTKELPPVEDRVGTPVKPDGTGTTTVSDTGATVTSPTAPVDLVSTGISDSSPGTIYNGPNGPEVVLDSGKTVLLSDYQAALDSGQPISIDGNMTTGGATKVDKIGVPRSIENPGTGPLPDGTELAPISSNEGTVWDDTLDTYVNPTTGAYFSTESNAWVKPISAPVPPPITDTTGGTTPGVSVPVFTPPTVDTTVAPGPVSPGVDVTPAPATPGGSVPVDNIPEITITDTRPVAPPVYVPPVGPTTPGPTTPGPVSDIPEIEVVDKRPEDPNTPVVPGPTTPVSDIPEIEVVDKRPVVPDSPVVETPVVETPVVETPVVETPVVETPVTPPVVYPPIYVPPVTEPPVVKKTGYDPLDPYNPVMLPALSNTGTNPGWFTNVPEQYAPSGVRSQYFWGQHPFQTGAKFSPEQYQQVAAPVAPWGLQQMYNPQTQTIESLLQGVKAAAATAPYNLPAAPKV